MEADRSLQQLAGICVSMDGSEIVGCTVAKFGYLARVDDRDVYYALYASGPVAQADAEGGQAPTDEPVCPDAAMIFEGDVGGSGAAPVLLSARGDSPGEFCFSTPSLVTSRPGMVLVIPCSEVGSGSLVCDDYFLRRDGAWLALDTGHWEGDLKPGCRTACRCERASGST